MFRYIAFATFIITAIAGVLLNLAAATNSGKNLLELATMNDFGFALLVWGQYPVAAAILLVLFFSSFFAFLAADKK